MEASFCFKCGHQLGEVKPKEDVTTGQRACAGAAQVLAESDSHVEAETKLGEAQAKIDEVAGLFLDEDLRSKFLKSASKKSASKK